MSEHTENESDFPFGLLLWIVMGVFLGLGATATFGVVVLQRQEMMRALDAEGAREAQKSAEQKVPP